MACNDAIASDEKRWSPCVEVSAGSFGGAVSGGRSSRVDSASRCDESDTRDRGVATMPSRGRSASDLRDDLGCDAKVCDDMLNSQAYLFDTPGLRRAHGSGGDLHATPPQKNTVPRRAPPTPKPPAHIHGERGDCRLEREHKRRTRRPGTRTRRSLRRPVHIFLLLLLSCVSADRLFMFCRGGVALAQDGSPRSATWRGFLGVTTRSTLNTKG